MQKYLFGIFFLTIFGAIFLNLTGCSGVPSLELDGAGNPPRVSFERDALSNVSGMWEYREGDVVYDLLLDGQGNGSYDWQQGHFETSVLTQGLWKGTWVQVGNDREGGFEARLAGNGMSARGRWWYTRIGNDTDPLEPGGEFTLERKGRLDGVHVLGAGSP